MKTFMSTLMVVGLLAAAAHAEFDPFSDPSLALPRSEQVSDDGHRQALPRSGNDDYRDALPFTEETFLDIVVSTP
jgi:hypothetical protein